MSFSEAIFILETLETGSVIILYNTKYKFVKRTKDCKDLEKFINQKEIIWKIHRVKQLKNFNELERETFCSPYLKKNISKVKFDRKTRQFSKGKFTLFYVIIGEWIFLTHIHTSIRMNL